ncbi:MAG: hypothetical protein RR478_04680, partial [Bacilli bacterium]
KYCYIYNYPIGVEIELLKKDEIIEYIDDIKTKYIKFFIESLDKEEYINLKLVLKNTTILNVDKKFIDKLIINKIIFVDGNINIPIDIENILKNLVKNKQVLINVKKWNRLYKLIDGIIVAYGCLDSFNFDDILDSFKNKDKVLVMLDIYNNNDYIIKNGAIISTKLNNKKRINKYIKSNVIKNFTNRELINLGNSTYHHGMKSYKKLIKTLKRNYVFKNHDILFVDNKIIIPYLYNSLNDEETARVNLECMISDYFEFNNEKLKELMLTKIIEIKKNFPLWEYRGFSREEGV